MELFRIFIISTLLSFLGRIVFVEIFSFLKTPECEELEFCTMFQFH